MNVYGLQKKKKNMIDHLRSLYLEKEKLETKLSKVNNHISQLEKAKNNCNKQIRRKRK